MSAADLSADAVSAIPTAAAEPPHGEAASSSPWARTLAMLVVLLPMLARRPQPGDDASPAEQPRRSQSGRFWIVPLLLLLSAGSARAQRPALAYSIPEAGTWVEYAAHWRDADGTHDGTLTLRNAGVHEANKSVWIETRKTWTKSGEKTTHLRKIAIATTDPGRDMSVEILAALDQPIWAKSPKTFDVVKAREFWFLGFDRGIKLSVVEKTEDLACGLGTFAARPGTARGHVGAENVEYRVWLTERVPFGWGKFEVTGAAQGVIFRATANRTGANAAAAPKPARP